MNIEQIKTFLAVVDYGTISAAADYLFITQSNVSKRLNSLEEELGVKLILRQQGYRTIQLTEYGINYVPIARQMLTLLDTSNKLKNLEDIKSLRIASIDAVNNFTFVPLFLEHINNYPNIKLSIYTHHSNEIHNLVETNSTDIGFVFSRINYSFIVSKPIYREFMYLVCHKDSKYYENYDPALLDPHKEVYLYWGHDFQQWHNRFWSPNEHNLITVNVGSMIQLYLNEKDNWGIAPMSVIEAMRSRNPNSNIVYYRLKNSPPPRICYEITHRYPNSYQQSVINTFEKELDNFICNNKYVCKYESWMEEEEI